MSLGQVDNREGKIRCLVGDESTGGGIVRDGGGDNTERSTGLGDADRVLEVADHEEHERDVEEEEERG